MNMICLFIRFWAYLFSYVDYRCFSVKFLLFLFLLPHDSGYKCGICWVERDNQHSCRDFYFDCGKKKLNSNVIVNSFFVVANQHWNAHTITDQLFWYMQKLYNHFAKNSDSMANDLIWVTNETESDPISFKFQHFR